MRIPPSSSSVKVLDDKGKRFTSFTPSNFATTNAPSPADPKTTAVAIPSALNARKPLTGSPLSSSHSCSSELVSGDGAIDSCPAKVDAEEDIRPLPLPLIPSIGLGRLRSKCALFRNSGGGRASLAACLAYGKMRAVNPNVIANYIVSSELEG
jgi:hypothetical protein